MPVDDDSLSEIAQYDPHSVFKCFSLLSKELALRRKTCIGCSMAHKIYVLWRTKQNLILLFRNTHLLGSSVLLKQYIKK